ncbi:MAG: hypothetical protein U9Q69_02460 [Nanoarchaeota archaeon]|nr:hypothetical protein [Nanoarchaeota archaeon]
MKAKRLGAHGLIHVQYEVKNKIKSNNKDLEMGTYIAVPVKIFDNIHSPF